MTLDERDITILSAISEHESGSTELLHEATGIPKSTIHYRLQNLAENGVIMNDLLQLSREEIGLDITVISEIWAEFGDGYHEVIGRELSEIEGVNDVYFTMGETDFIVIARLSSRDMVETLINDYQSVDGINRTSSKFAITEMKNEIDITELNNYSIETLLAASDGSNDKE